MQQSHDEDEELDDLYEVGVLFLELKGIFDFVPGAGSGYYHYAFDVEEGEEVCQFADRQAQVGDEGKLNQI